jgi:hypothetical protein
MRKQFHDSDDNMHGMTARRMLPRIAQRSFRLQSRRSAAFFISALINFAAACAASTRFTWQLL